VAAEPAVMSSTNKGKYSTALSTTSRATIRFPCRATGTIR
jgi:hypothetical protein